MTEAEHAVEEQLRAEAAAIHRAIFRREAGPVVLQRYLDAHREGLGRCPDPEAACLRRALARNLDLAAMEFVLRSRVPAHALVRKFRIMFYVAEGSPGYFQDFVNARHRRLQAFVSLGGAVLRSAWLWARGLYMLRRCREQ